LFKDWKVYFVNDAQQMSLTVHYHTYKHDDWSTLVKYG